MHTFIRPGCFFYVRESVLHWEHATIFFFTFRLYYVVFGLKKHQQSMDPHSLATIRTCDPTRTDKRHLYTSLLLFGGTEWMS